MTTTSNPPENPPAFPTHSVGKEPGTEPFQVSEGGLTMRDYFAAKALQGMCANAGIMDCWPKGFADELAEQSFRVADAMLAARKGDK